MPETRYIDTYSGEVDENGNAVLVEREPYEVSDEELYQEQLAKEFNDTHNEAISALKNWDKLTPPKKDVMLKYLLRRSLWKDGWLKPGVL